MQNAHKEIALLNTFTGPSDNSFIFLYVEYRTVFVKETIFEAQMAIIPQWLLKICHRTAS